MKVENINVANQGWLISDCCNSKVKGIKGFVTVCNVCGMECSTTTKPEYEEVSKGIYRKIVYNG